MNRQQKALVVEGLKKDFSDSQATFLVGFKGLTVKQMQSLRKELRQKGGTLKIAKARLMLRATEGEAGIEQLIPFLKGQIGLVFASNESPAIAKVLHDFSKGNEALELVAGYLDSQLLDQETIVHLASLPSKEVLLAQVCGTLKAPAIGLAAVLNVLVLRFLWTLKQVGEKKGS